MLGVWNGLVFEENNLIFDDIASSRNRAAFNNCERSIVFQPRNEVNALMCQLDKPLVIDIAAIHYYDGTTLKSEPSGHLDIACLAVGNDCKRRQESVMIQEEMQFDGALCPPELGPIIK
jgi:hypothetical protein